MQDDNRLHLLSHHPKGIDGDALGFRDYACTICEILTGLTAENTGLTVGIFGDWGSGKSTVLRIVSELLTPTSPRLAVRIRRKLKKWTGVWYWSIGRASNKGRRLRSLWTHGQKTEHIKPKRYRPLVVTFDAWEYGKDQVWVALLRTIVQTANESLWPWQTVGIRLKLWVRRVQWDKLAIHSVWIAVRMLIALLVLYMGLLLVQRAGLQSGWLGQLVNWLINSLGLYSTIQWAAPQPQVQTGWLDQLISWLQVALGLSSTTAAIWILFSTLAKGIWQGVRWIFTVRLRFPSNLLRPTLDKDIPYAAEQFRQALLDLIQIIGRRRPIIVLMDDLDRAPIDQIAPVLEAIKHFGVEPDARAPEQLKKQRAPIAFVFAADRGVIQHAVASYYKDFWATLGRLDTERFAREYLEKIVQIPLELPPLSSSHLSNLFKEEEPIASSDKKDGIWTLASARQQTQGVFAQTPKENPRQVIRAYNTFQALWRVVQQRRLQEIEPKLLSVLILIRYIWPEVFEQIFRYPELFFDLHALATKEPNELCSRTEIEELLSLGCPAAEHTPMIETVRHKQPDLLRLLGPVRLPERLDADKLFTYLTLIKDQPAPTGFHLIESGAALLSGDPSLIKFAVRTNPQVRRERLPWLMEFLEFESSTMESRSPSKSQRKDKREGITPVHQEQSAETEMSRALFALGRIGEGRAVEPIKRMISIGASEREVVAVRAVFALAHLAGDRSATGETKEVTEAEKRRRAARRALAEILRDNETPPALRLRILRLLGPILPLEPEARRPIIYVALRDAMEIVRDQALKLAKQGGWLEEALDELNAGPQTEEAYEGYFEIVGNPPETILALPELVREHLLKLAADGNSPHQTRAFEALANFPNAGMVVQYVADVAMTTQDEEIRRMAITRMGECQAVPGVGWQARAWTRIEEALTEEPPEVFIRALGITGRVEAVSRLEKALTHSDTRVRKAAFEELLKIADSEADEEAATEAQAVLDQRRYAQET